MADVVAHLRTASHVAHDAEQLILYSSIQHQSKQTSSCLRERGLTWRIRGSRQCHWGRLRSCVNLGFLLCNKNEAGENANCFPRKSTNQLSILSWTKPAYERTGASSSSVWLKIQSMARSRLFCYCAKTSDTSAISSSVHHDVCLYECQTYIRTVAFRALIAWARENPMASTPAISSSLGAPTCGVPAG
jgi:hypothetical protein